MQNFSRRTSSSQRGLCARLTGALSRGKHDHIFQRNGVAPFSTTLTNSPKFTAQLGTTACLARLAYGDGAHWIATPMDLPSHINLGEMLGDLTVATFLILLPASVVVVGLMVMLPLLDLAFGKKVKPRSRYDGLSSDDAAWQAGRPWLMLRSIFLPQRMSNLRARGRGRITPLRGRDQFPEPQHWTSLIKRTRTATLKDTTLIVADNEAIPDRASKHSNAA
jgi:hypothetical protein